MVVLLPIAWRFGKGSRIRLAIAGADIDNYGQVPHGSPPVAAARTSLSALSMAGIVPAGGRNCSKMGNAKLEHDVDREHTEQGQSAQYINALDPARWGDGALCGQRTGSVGSPVDLGGDHRTLPRLATVEA